MSYPQPLSTDPTPTTTHAFTKMCQQEDYHLSDVMRGLCACQTIMEEQRAGSAGFRLAEQGNTKSAVQELAQVSYTLKELVNQAGYVESGQAVPGALVTALDVARETIGRFRSVLVHNHVFYKINYSLVRSKTGIVDKLAEATEMTKDLVTYVERHPRPVLPN